MPLVGAYCASKFALEAAADALRMELRPWHIGVAIVEPAQTDTDMWRTADDMVEETEAALTAEQRDVVRQTHRGLQEDDPGVAEDGRSRREGVRRRRGGADRPQATARYVVGVGPKLQMALMTNLPASLRDRVLRRVSGQPLVFVKRSTEAPRGFFACEAAGLQWLSAADGGVPCAAVIAYDDTSLTLERLDRAAPTRVAAHEFGRRLARTHDAGRDCVRRAARRLDRSRVLRAAAAAVADVVLRRRASGAASTPTSGWHRWPTGRRRAWMRRLATPSTPSWRAVTPAISTTTIRRPGCTAICGAETSCGRPAARC